MTAQCPWCRLNADTVTRTTVDYSRIHKPAVDAPASATPMPAHPRASGLPGRSGAPTPETARDGRESSLSDSPLGRSHSRSSQAASPLASRSRGTG